MQENREKKDDQEEQHINTGAILGAVAGAGIPFSTGALGTLWAAVEASSASATIAGFINGTTVGVPLMVSLPVIAPIVAGAAIGGGMVYVGYRAGFFSNAPRAQSQKNQEENPQAAPDFR